MFVHEFRRERLIRIIQKLRFVTFSHPLALLLIIDMLKLLDMMEIESGYYYIITI